MHKSTNEKKEKKRVRGRINKRKKETPERERLKAARGTDAIVTSCDHAPCEASTRSPPDHHFPLPLHISSSRASLTPPPTLPLPSSSFFFFPQLRPSFQRACKEAVGRRRAANEEFVFLGFTRLVRLASRAVRQMTATIWATTMRRRHRHHPSLSHLHPATLSPTHPHPPPPPPTPGLGGDWCVVVTACQREVPAPFFVTTASILSFLL